MVQEATTKPFLQNRKLIFPAHAPAEHQTGSMAIRLLKQWQEIHNAAYAADIRSFQANPLICTLNTFCNMLCSMQISIPKYPKKSSAPTAIQTAILQLGRVDCMLCWAPWHGLTGVSGNPNCTSIYVSYRNKANGDDNLEDCLKDLTPEASSEVYSFKIYIKLKKTEVNKLSFCLGSLQKGSKDFKAAILLPCWRTNFLFLLVPQGFFIMPGEHFILGH